MGAFALPSLEDEKTLLPLQDAVAEGFGGYSTLRKYISEGYLRASKIGGRIKIERADLEALKRPTGRQPTFEDIESAVSRIAAAAPPAERSADPPSRSAPGRWPAMSTNKTRQPG